MADWHYIANQADKLSFISLMNEIDSDHKEKEIIEAVIRAIVPSLPLCKRFNTKSVKEHFEVSLSRETRSGVVCIRC